MILTIIVVLFSLVVLTALHELGHFFFAKKFGVKVEEFGIGYPPRIIGKKVGETLYSLNLLPFGAFVKIMGEDGGDNNPRSFSQKPIYQRALILVGGVLMFWIIAFLIFTLLAGVFGIPTAVPDDLDIEAQVKVVSVANDSPADQAGIKMGDTLIKIQEQEIDKIDQVVEFSDSKEELFLSILRDQKEIQVSLIPREIYPSDEGAMGIGLVRVADMKTDWYKSPLVGLKITKEQTINIPKVLFKALIRKIKGEKVKDVQFVGPIGVGKMLGNALYEGVGSFLMLIAMISIWLALFNIFPIPALDGGRLLFLLIEWIRRKPMPQKIEGKVNAGFFILLIILMIFITLKDIIGLL